MVKLTLKDLKDIDVLIVQRGCIKCPGDTEGLKDRIDKIHAKIALIFEEYEIEVKK